MPSVCVYFQVHQPYRLKRYTYLSVGRDPRYFDDRLNTQIMKKVAENCYLPTNRLLLELIQRYRGAFNVSFSISGVAIEQLARTAPDVLDSFKELAATGHVEFLAETYYHSLAYLYDEVEFREQVALHAEAVQREFGQVPSVIRNTELVYDDRFGELAASMGYRGVLAEGVDDVLGWRSPNFVYRVPKTDARLLLRNYRFSDDIAFRFSQPGWPGYPVTAQKFAGWLQELTGNSDFVGLFMDYETFGEHQHRSTGIFDFLEQLPEQILADPDWDFKTPSEIIGAESPLGELSFTRTTSWADVARDLSAWSGSRMQASALRRVYEELGPLVKATNNPELIEIWRKIQTSDHFYYMSTKLSGDGIVHQYFRPFESPYDAFIVLMNVLRDFKERVSRAAGVPLVAAAG
jgi:alpha-amylase